MWGAYVEVHRVVGLVSNLAKPQVELLRRVVIAVDEERAHADHICCLRPVQLLAGLFDVLKESSVMEATTVGALAVGERENVVPNQAVGLGSGCKHFKDVGQFGGELRGRGLPCLMGLLDELFQESSPVALLVKDVSDGLVPVCSDDLRDAVTDQLAVRDLHGADVTVRPRTVQVS